MKTGAPPDHFANLAMRGAAPIASFAVDLAHSRRDRQRALELRRDVYRRKGLLGADSVKPRVLPHAFAPGSAMFVAKKDDAVVGTITFYLDSAIGLPMDEVHREEVDAMRGRFARVAEVGGLAVLEEWRCAGVAMMLYEATFRWAVAAKAECIVACVNPSSRRVYSKLLLFDVLGGCKQHPRFLGAPSIPIGLDLTTFQRRFVETYDDEVKCRFQDLIREADLPYTFAGIGSATYLQWSDEEVSELIRTNQLACAGDHRSYVERQYLPKLLQ